jgi:predicted phosphodiesterase
MVIVNIWSVSDLHTDESENANLVYESFESKKQLAGEVNVLLCAGDISQFTRVLRDTLKLLTDLYDHVFFVPGNNELRLASKRHQEHDDEENKSSITDSLHKFKQVLKICKDIGVHVEPMLIHGVYVVPLFSWYAPQFASKYSEEKHDTAYTRRWLDFRRCTWPDGMESTNDSVAKYFADFNEKMLETHPRLLEFGKQGRGKRKNSLDDVAEDKSDEKILTVVSFSHFLPREDLIQWYVLWYRPDIINVLGSPFLEDQIRKIGSSIHVYGHSHVNSDSKKNGVQYIQHALGHPEERGTWMRPSKGYSPKLVCSHKIKS